MQGLGFLTLSAVLPSLGFSYGQSTDNSPSHFQVVLFFFSLYLVAVSQSGHKPCTQAFGADQFDGQHPEECKAKSSFFNWWYFGLCTGMSVGFLILSYIQENLNWGLGFGVPCILMVAALLLFLLGTKTYRYSINRYEESPLLRVGKGFIKVARNWRTQPSVKVADEAFITPNCLKDGQACSSSERTKQIRRLFPIWLTSLLFGILPAQPTTFFTKQGVTMDRSIGSGFNIPAASLLSLNTIAIVIFIPIYDRILVPIARHFTKKPSGISTLQRIGVGMVMYIISIVVAASIEIKRLKKAEEHGLVDKPNVPIPMSVLWLVPQYVLSGVGDALAMVGFQEFFYDQVPSEFRSVGIALYLSIFGLGSLLSSFLIAAIDVATGGDGQGSWFNDNLNKAHLDYFYWLVSGLGLLGFSGYLYFAKSYIYNLREMRIRT